MFRYKDGQKLSAEANANIKITRDKNRQESYSMTLNMCKYQDTGEYECRVSNDQGTTSTKCNVVVNGKPASQRSNYTHTTVQSLFLIYRFQRFVFSPSAYVKVFKTKNMIFLAHLTVDSLSIRMLK